MSRAIWDFQQCGMCDQQRLRPDCAYKQSDQSICKWLEYSMTQSSRLLTEHHLNFLRRLHRLVWVYTCQKATLLEITCRGSIKACLLFACWVILHDFCYLWIFFSKFTFTKNSFRSQTVYMDLDLGPNSLQKSVPARKTFSTLSEVFLSDEITTFDFQKV